MAKCVACGAAAAVILLGCQSINEAASQAAEDVKTGLQSVHDSNDALKAGNTYTVRGRVSLRDGQTLTCFDGIQTGYLGPRDLARPGDGSFDPRTGTISLRTAAMPATVLTRSGTFIQNNCDRLAAEGVLEAPASSTPGLSATGSLNPRTPCRDVPAAMQSQYRKCVSFDRADHCSALPVDGTWLNGQTDLAAICDSRKTKALMEKEAQYQRSQSTGSNPEAKKK